MKSFRSAAIDRMARAGASFVGVLMMVPLAEGVLFRLPIAVDSGIHFYYDHDSGSGLSDWKCGTQTYNGHRGTDYTGANAGRNTPIYAAANGTLYYKIDGFGDGWGGNTDGGGAGNHVVLSHADGFRTYYLHMEKGTVTSRATGSSISCGTQIGRIGTSGNSTGNHLHFEPRKWNGSSYVADDPYAGPCSGSVSWWLEQTGGSPINVCQGEMISAPGNLVATAVAHNRIELTWVDNSSIESGYKIERGLHLTGPWTEIANVPANTTSFSNTNLLPWSTFFYRVRGYNSDGESLNSLVASATTFNQPPILGGMPNRTVSEGSTVSFNATSVDFALGQTQVIAAFDGFANGTSSVLFHEPGYTVTSRGFISSSPNESTVTAYFPTGNGTRRTLLTRWSVLSSAQNPWIRLTTAHAPHSPNPVVALNSVVRFSIFTEDSLKVGLGVREIMDDPLVGSDGGVSGPIEFVGVPGVDGGRPEPGRIVSTRRWVDVEFDLASEPVSAFTGDGVLASPHGKGVLEHLVLVPNAGWGSYRVWLDNFTVSVPNVLTYTLDPGAPDGATIHPATGAFSWSPTEAQGPGVYEIAVRVTDNGVPKMSDVKTFLVTVDEVNQHPELAFITDKFVNAGSTLVFANSAFDPDIPANVLTYSLDAGAPAGAAIDPATGVFTWAAPMTPNPLTNTLSIRVTDDGQPPLSNSRTFRVIVVPSPAVSSFELSDAGVVLNWGTFPGKSYRIQYKDDFAEPHWSDLGPEVIAGGNSLTITNTPSAQQRFYRIVQLD